MNTGKWVVLIVFSLTLMTYGYGRFKGTREDPSDDIRVQSLDRPAERRLHVGMDAESQGETRMPVMDEGGTVAPLPQVEEEKTIAALPLKRQFHPDPYVDLIGANIEHDFCKKRDRFFESVKDAAALEVIRVKLTTHCENIKNNYQGFLLSEKKLLAKLEDGSVITGVVEAFEGVSRGQKNEAETLVFLKELIDLNSSHMFMVMSKNRLSSSSNQIFYDRAPAEFKNVHGAYFQYLLSEAFLYLSCDSSQGFSCGVASLQMIEKCKKDVDVCGMDYQKWFNHYITENQQTEIRATAKVIQQL